MRNYTKAYTLDRLRQFAGFSAVEGPAAARLADDTVVYIRDDFQAVTFEAVFEDEAPETDLVVKDVTPEWKAFCESELGFAIPEDLKFMYEEEEAAPAAAT